jgi:signal transduction histidine kinase
MKRKRSLSVRLTLVVLGIMALANALTGASYLYLSRQTDHVPVKLFALVRSPFQILVLSFLFGILLSLAFSRILLRPLNQLIDATKKIAKGDFSVRVRPTDSDDEMAELVGSFNDMTKELGSNELFKKDFINSFSHEFKTPIVSIRGFAKQLKRDDLTGEQKREYVEIIIQESERLANMSSNILLLTKLENQEIMTDLSEFMLDEQIRRSILLLEKQWTDKRLELDLDLPELRIRANEEMLSHVWINIVGNAIKFSNEGGRISVSCHLAGDAARVVVKDAGIGMDEATRSRIFDKFYQGEVTGSLRPSHATEGNGLGLPLARRIVELSGGTIKVESEPGKGSAFVVELPLAM